MPFPDTATIARRQARVRSALDALNLDALVISDPTNIRYLSNHVGSAGVLVLTRTDAHLLVDFRYEEAVRALQASPAASPDLRTRQVPGSYDDALVECLCEIGVTAVGFEAGHMTYARHEWLTRTLPARDCDVALRSTVDVVERIRVVKDDVEIAALRESAARLA